MIQTDDDLVKDSLAGVKESFRQLYDRYGKQVFRQSFALTGNLQEAEDLLQEVFCQAFLKLNQYRGPGSFKKWVLTICRNQAINHLKKKSVKTFSFDFKDENCLTNPIPAADRLKVLDEKENVPFLLEALEPIVREVLLLRLVEGLSYREIAELVGLREENLRQIVSRGLTQLKKEQKPDVLQQV
ncbi:MAG: RNA polymerase sigma factor [Candidatus Ozemobacteraceae bacterium]